MLTIRVSQIQIHIKPWSPSGYFKYKYRGELVANYAHLDGISNIDKNTNTGGELTLNHGHHQGTSNTNTNTTMVTIRVFKIQIQGVS